MAENKRTEAVALLSYAVGTEVDAVAMYNYLLKTLDKKYFKIIKHIRDEEKEHIEELTKLIRVVTGSGGI